MNVLLLTLVVLMGPVANSQRRQGRIVAYQFTCFAIRARDGHIRERFGAASTLRYVAEDGAGTFVRQSGFRPLQILPDWVKEVAAEP